jgi:hypothetical protein
MMITMRKALPPSNKIEMRPLLRQTPKSPKMQNIFQKYKTTVKKLKMKMKKNGKQ